MASVEALYWHQERLADSLGQRLCAEQPEVDQKFPELFTRRNRPGELLAYTLAVVIAGRRMARWWAVGTPPVVGLCYSRRTARTAADSVLRHAGRSP